MRLKAVYSVSVFMFYLICLESLEDVNQRNVLLLPPPSPPLSITTRTPRIFFVLRVPSISFRFHISYLLLTDLPEADELTKNRTQTFLSGNENKRGWDLSFQSIAQKS